MISGMRSAAAPSRLRVTGLRDAGTGSLISALGGAVVVAGVACTLAWVLTGADGSFWPVWVWVGGGAGVAAPAALRISWRVPAGPARWAAAHAGLAAVGASLATFVWLLTGRGPWLSWTLLGMGVAFAVHALLAFADRLPPRPREQALSRRVDELVRTRRGALDAELSELRRIERDLHDGAQARLVSLSMALGRAEHRLGGRDDAETLALVRGAHQEATAAIAELRGLSRGMAPPLLEERGLCAAVAALAKRSPLEVTLDADGDPAVPPVVGRTAYFVIAEALTNVAKHAPGAVATVRLRALPDTLVIEVVDAGPGGADPHGSGLAGLRRRVEAIDGRLAIDVAEPHGTRLRAELPCAS